MNTHFAIPAACSIVFSLSLSAATPLFDFEQDADVAILHFFTQRPPADLALYVDGVALLRPGETLPESGSGFVKELGALATDAFRAAEQTIARSRAAAEPIGATPTLRASAQAQWDRHETSLKRLRAELDSSPLTLARLDRINTELAAMPGQVERTRSTIRFQQACSDAGLPADNLLVGLATSMEKILPRALPFDVQAARDLEVSLARNEKATRGKAGPGTISPPGPATTPIRLLTEQRADGEFVGWKSFHETPGTKTADVWKLQPDGVLVCGGTPRGYLYTEQEYTDFTLQFEWRYPPGATNSNGGALVRMTGDHGIWPKCLEFQLNQDQAGDFWAIRGYEFSGPADRLKVMTNATFGILRHVKRLADLEKPIGEWNQFEGIVNGGTVIQKVNGALANQATGCEVVPGRILLTSEGQAIHFRNVRLMD